MAAAAEEIETENVIKELIHICIAKTRYCW